MLPARQTTYLPAIDGMRALAVIAVMAYHLAPQSAPGGFFGVEVFFAISGFLITGLLRREYMATGGVDLGRFWLRRARRLLPAVVALLVVMLTVSAIALPDELARLRADSLAALTYSTNWYLVVRHVAYFEAVGRPSMLLHLWSLAVEEQFYLVWPPLLLLLCGRPRATVALTLLGAIASTLAMAWLAPADGDPSRVYYGTDTRAPGFLLGAALAFWDDAPGRGGRAAGAMLDLVGLVALAELVWFVLAVDAYHPLLYRGGFAAVGFSALVVMAAATRRDSLILRPLLGLPPLAWLGRRSYSLYLWHWPVAMLTRPQLDTTLDGLWLLALRIGLTLVLAEASYRFVETPFRSGAVGDSLRTLVRSRLSGPSAYRWGAAALSAIVWAAVIGRSVAMAEPPAAPSYLQVSEVRIVATAPLALTPAPTPISGSLRGHQIAMLGQARRPEPTPTIGTAARELAYAGVGFKRNPPPLRVLAVGDSVMLGAAQGLVDQVGTIEVDAQVGRQIASATEILVQRRDAGTLGDVVVVQIGNNGPMREGQFAALLETLRGVRRVVVVDVKLPRNWQDGNNAQILATIPSYPNVRLVDWYAASKDRPELFWHDGLHLRPEGARLYAELVLEQIRAK